MPCRGSIGGPTIGSGLLAAAAYTGAYGPTARNRRVQAILSHTHCWARKPAVLFRSASSLLILSIRPSLTCGSRHCERREKEPHTVVQSFFTLRPVNAPATGQKSAAQRKAPARPRGRCAAGAPS